MIEITTLASGSTGNCYHVTDGKTRLLLECGIPFKRIQQGLGFSVSGVAGCLVTHEHKDHSRAVNEVMGAGIDCYMSYPTKVELELFSHRVKTVKPKRHFRVGTWIIMPFKTEHDAAYPFGYLLYSIATKDRLLFATDTYYVRYRLSGLTHIMVEANYAADILQANVDAGSVPVALKNRLLQSHFSLDNVKEFLRANDLTQVQEIHLLHLSSGNSDAERFKREVMELTGKPTFIA